MGMTTDVTGEAITNSAVANCGWAFVVLMSRQGKIRLSEFFQSYTESEKRRILRDIGADILVRMIISFVCLFVCLWSVYGCLVCRCWLIISCNVSSLVTQPYE